MSEKIVQLNEEVIKGQLKELVRGSVEETLNELLEQEAEKLTQAARYERNEARQGYRSGHYDRSLTTTSGDVTLHVPRLKGVFFETAIIERYRRRESSVEETLTYCDFPSEHWTRIRTNNVILPKTEYTKRDIWTADMIRTALDQCKDSKLYVAMNLAFACSLRMGEILGLTWDNVHISDEDIAEDNAYVYIDKELTRASKRAIETLGEKDIYYIFTPLFPNTSTRLILKKPKTDSSIRKVWLPKTLAYILREWKAAQDELRSFLGDEYQEFNLVVALPNGRPCEDRIILKEFSKLREEAGLPKVVFHSLRHSSTTYKLKLNHGDLKATQGDTGHAEIDMITTIYAHILDKDRKVNAQKFETAFYANPDLRGVKPPEEPKQAEPAALDLASLVEQLQQSPELAQTLASLISAQAGGR